MEDIAFCGASEVAKCLVAPVGRHCGYVIYSDQYVLQLNGEVEKLDRTRQRVQHSIDEAENNLRQIEADVREWVNKEKTVASKARAVLDYNGRAKKTCFYGWLPNPKARYHVGKEASRMLKDIQALDTGTQFEKVDFKNPPPGLFGGASDMNSSAGDADDLITGSRASIFQGIMKALNDEKVKVVGVYGPGGVGKTTLLEIVEKELRQEGRPFHTIVKAEVSRTPDLNNIQDQIADVLSLNLKARQSQQGRRDLLFQRLRGDPNGKVLIILDDLWEGLDLKAVGIPSGDKSMNCKLLLASRDERMLKQKMHADQTFRLEGLEEDEAFRLFESIVRDKLKDDEELKVKAAKVVKKLEGLPLLITSVASTLKCSNMSTWESMLVKIEDSNIERIVKWSYDHVESEDAKCLFLLCGLIGGTIEVELLLGLSMGLGLFEGYSNRIQYSRNRLNMMLDSLHSFCLLQYGGDGKENVTIHDIYSEVVVSDVFSGENSLMINNYGSWPKEKLEKCWAICLTDVGKDKLAQLISCQFFNLKILMLTCPERWMLACPHNMTDCSGLKDFPYMKKLQVLYLHSMHITALPILENLRSLYINNCLVEDVANIGKLKALQVLSFEGSEIFRLPKEIGKLTNLRSLNLSKCCNLKIKPGVIKGLINLEELYMKRRFVGTKGMINMAEIVSGWRGAWLAELKSLTKLASLEISICHTSIPLKDGDLLFQNLDRFWIQVGTVMGREYEGLTTMKLNLEGCESILSRKWVQENLKKTEYLCLCKLSGFEKSIDELCLQEVRYLQIEDSPSIKYIANSFHGLPPAAFSKLESLFLKNLINLDKICHGLVAQECFSKLKAVSVGQCDRLKYLWCLSDIQRLVQLEEIKVWKCYSMQSIVIDDAREIVSTSNKVELPNVRRLVLCALPNMTSFCTEAEITSEDIPIQVLLPHLESLTMVGLLGLEKILSSEPSLKYSNLRSLMIKESKCTSESILKLDWILKLPNLESMGVESSLSAEVLFDLEELKVSGVVEILSRLTELTLEQLPNVQNMWKQDVQLRGILIFRNLKKLSINNTGLSFLFPVSVAKCLGEIRDITVEDCPRLKVVIVDEEGRDEGTDDIILLRLLERLSIHRCPVEKFFSYAHGKRESITSISDSQDTYSDSFFDQKISLPNVEELILNSAGSFKRIWHGTLPEDSFNKLANLTLKECSDVIDVFPSTIIGRLSNLEGVEVSKCPSLELLFDCGSLYSNTELKTVSLGKLKRVRVSGAGRLRHVVMSDSQTVLYFPCLRNVVVQNCSVLRYLFPNNTAATLRGLKKLVIIKCEQMKEVVSGEEGGRSEAEVMRFPSLTDLFIWGCSNFGAFIRSPTSAKRQLGQMIEENDELPQLLFSDMVAFPNLRGLYIRGSQCKELWSNQISDDSFCKLEFLVLKGCDNLQRIAPSHVWKRLQQSLKTLEVKSCRSIEIIYESDGTVAGSGNLKRLVLCDLENLRHIWRYNNLPNIPFPSLRYVKVVRCSRLEVLFTTFTEKFLEQIKELVIGSCEDMELIAGHKECEEATGTTVTFPKLTTLRLYNLPKFRSFLPEKYSVEFPLLDARIRTEDYQSEEESEEGSYQDSVESVDSSEEESTMKARTKVTRKASYEEREDEGYFESFNDEEFDSEFEFDEESEEESNEESDGESKEESKGSEPETL